MSFVHQCGEFAWMMTKLSAYSVFLIGLFMAFFPANHKTQALFIYAKMFSAVGLFFVSALLFFACNK